MAARPPRRRTIRLDSARPPGRLARLVRAGGASPDRFSFARPTCDVTGRSYDSSARPSGQLSRSGARPAGAVPTTATASLFAATLWLSTVMGEKIATLGQARVVVLVVSVPVILFARSTTLRCLLIAACGACGGSAAWHATAPPIEGDCAGVVRLISDPVPRAGAVSVVVSLEGRRYDMVAYGPNARRLMPRFAGESVRVSGSCGPVAGMGARYARITHVVGRLRPTAVSEEFDAGSMAARASNRLRGWLARGVRSMPEDLRSLFLGLVIGDDRFQAREMITNFRRSGLSHLCAVSGQNVAYLLAAASPMLVRRRRHTRWLLTIGVICWFALLTRAEPSVLRASVMAGFAATSSVLGRALNARNVLCASVCVLLVVDPMLAWSVGFALSVGATAGLAWVSAPLSRAMSVPRAGPTFRALNTMLSSTLAAQLGTFPVSLAVFGSVPVVSLITNPLALGVAGAVMMFGLPVALVASVAGPLEHVSSAAMVVPVGWVNQVAMLGARVGPTGALNVFLWVCIGFAVLSRMCRLASSRLGSTHPGGSAVAPPM